MELKESLMSKWNRDQERKGHKNESECTVTAKRQKDWRVGGFVTDQKLEQQINHHHLRAPEGGEGVQAMPHVFR